MKNFFKEHKKMIGIVSFIVLILSTSILLFLFFNNISKSEVKEIIYAKTKLKKEEIEFSKIKLNSLQNKYEVTFIYHGIIFNYTINSKSGKVLKNNFDDYPDKNYESPAYFDYIPEDKAKALVANDLNTYPDQIEFTSVKLKKGTYSAIYTLKLKYNDISYEYKVDGISGKILPGLTKTIQKNKK